MRKVLSNDIKARPIRFFFGFMIIWQGYDLTNLILTISSVEGSILEHIIFISIFIVFYIVFDNVKKVEYDDVYMYVTGKNGEEKIPFSSLQKMNPSSIKFRSGPRIWKIRYHDNKLAKKAVRITLRSYDEEFGRFVEIVKKQNKKFVVKRIMHPIDFDI